MSRPATHAEIRAHLGHGTGSRKVRIAKDGAVTYYGSTSDTDRSHDYWHEAGHIDQYGIEDDGAITPNRRVGRPLLGGQKRERYQIILEPRIAERARRIGGGNLSAGIARAVETFKS